MNLEIANRLYEYRKNAGLSQDQLADRIGVSRQAVSKWERGEASPDTDNLIALSEVYNVTLDELIKGKKTESSDNKNKNNTKETYISFEDGTLNVKQGEKEQKVHFGWKDVGFKGIHVDVPDTSVHIDKNGIFVKEHGHIYSKKKKLFKSNAENFFHKFPYPILTVIAYLLFGFFNIYGGWAYGWLVFLTIPLYYTLISAVCERNASSFAYPVLVVLVYLALGFSLSLWHPMWILFLTIPFYYFLCEFIKKLESKHFK